MLSPILPIAMLLVLSGSMAFAAEEAPDFNTHVMPVFRKYCNGCHNAKEAEGGLVLENYPRMIKGGENGPVVIAGKSSDSRMWKLISGLEKPEMPPKDQAAPSVAEKEIIRRWIDAGAKPPMGDLGASLVTPKIIVRGTSREPVTAIATDPAGNWTAIARPHRVQIVKTAAPAESRELMGHSGQISDISFSSDGKWLVVGAGESGLSGEATLWNAADWSRGRVFRGHRDAIYSTRISPDGNLLASASYDRDINIWDAREGTLLRTLSGHNDAVYGIDFAPSGRWLASASGDRTVKLWDVATGQRLDTFSQPAKDQYTVAFSPDGRFVAAGGVDFRVRVWGISDTAKEGTNTIEYARFAHEGPVLKVAFSRDGHLLASSSEDGLIKIWETKTFTQAAVLEKQKDWAATVCFSHDGHQLLVGRMNGDVTSYPVDPRWSQTAVSLTRLDDSVSTSTAKSTDARVQQEVEPNNTPATATHIPTPATVMGELKTDGDFDLYRMEAVEGQTWILETNASRSGSLADTKLEVLDADGKPVVRALLQAVRDSWINFRPIDSSSGDVRLEFWEEMDLNQYVYMNGEVCKTFRAPQGPDSGFQLYMLNGKRKNYFDTSATAHAKDEPCYIVEAYPAGSRIVENGLPIFPLYYANDDDAERKLDRDSRLIFTAPRDGTYLVKVSDVRGFSGEKYNYTLMVRLPQPNFSVAINTMNPKIPAGSGQRLKFTLNRIDHFDGDVRIDIAGLPAGFTASSPVVIPSGHVEATSVLTAAREAPEPRKEEWQRTTVLATGTIDGQLVTRTVGSLGEIKLEKPPVIRVRLVPDDPKYVSADGSLVITPGTTITARIVVERNGFEGDAKFDVDNLPHGVIVDNIGLSGVLVRANETERQIFLTARPWVPETTRLIHAVAQVQGNQASPAIPLRVQSRQSVSR